MRFRFLLFVLALGIPGVANAACPDIPPIARVSSTGSPFATDNKGVTRLDTQTSDNVRITGGCVGGAILVHAPSDGVADATPAIQAAVTASAASGGCAEIGPPSVNYKISTSIAVPSNGCIDGISGMPTILKLADGANVPIFQIASDATNVTIRNLRCEGNRANNTAGQCIAGGGGAAAKIAISNVWAHDFYQDGALISAVDGLSITGGGYWGNGQAGVSLQTGVTNFTISRTMAWDNGTHGVGCIGACTIGSIDHNIAWDNGQGDPATGATADNITGYNAGINHVTVAHNVMSGGGNNCMHFGGDDVTIEDNDCSDPTFNGILYYSKTLYATGTIAVTNGSASVTGTGTAWSGVFPFSGFRTNITIGGVAYLVQRVNSDTSLTLTANYAGSTASGLSYSMDAIGNSARVNLVNNRIKGIGAGATLGAILVRQLDGGTIVGNTSTDAAGQAGISLLGTSNLAVGPNTMKGKVWGLNLAEAVGTVPYITGTVTTTNGSPTITGSGTSWLNSIPNSGAYFQESGATTAYPIASVDSDTQITLASNYACTACGAGKSYTIADVNNGIAVSGGVYSNNTSVGVRSRNTINSAFSGYQANSNAVYGTQGLAVCMNNSFPTAGTSVGNGTAPASLAACALPSLTSASPVNGAAAATGTLTNAPAAGNPTKWIPINDNGTIRYMPAW